MRQVKFYIDDERYEQLRRLAEERGLTVPALVRSLVLRALSGEERELEEVVGRLEERVAQLTREVGRLGVELALLAKRVEKLERERRGGA
jgi:16S rRNA U516 pseudouridylate synthase RsuA-like enzyme